MTPGEHASEDRLEQYCLGTAPAGELEKLESHLLVCSACQDRLRESEAYVRTMQQATAQAAADQLMRQSRWRTLTGWLFRSVPAAAIAGAAALVLVSGVVPALRRGPPERPAAIALELTRGDDGSLRAHAPAGRPLLVTLDLTGLAIPSCCQVRIVDSSGAPVLEAAAKPDRERLTVSVPRRLARGTYWVRLYNPPAQRTPLREYELQLE
jgi:Putative zinc-finger